jgi:pimeloyl-ACP methyl ester carboxylesterase
MAGDAHRLLDHLAVPLTDVMGYSMGARIAAHLALAHPERVRSLLLGGIGDTMITGRLHGEEIVAALEAPDPAAVTHPVALQFRTFADRLGSDRVALAACIRAMQGDGIPPARLRTLAMPVQIVIGGDDVIAGSPGPLAAALPAAELVTVPRRDHMKTVGDRLYREAVLGFLAQVDATH